MNETPVLGVIGGSGLYELPGLTNVQMVHPETPYGKASAPIVRGQLDGKPVAFLARHGIGHIYNPTEINYRANIYSLKLVGVKNVVSISACGSLREDFAPGEIVIPDQLVDFTRGRERTFFEGGLVAHVGAADPFCPNMRQIARNALSSTGATVHYGGTLITVEGPRFSTRAESNLYRSWGISIIGMTTSPEAYLAREAELCYCSIAHVTDYDVWHVSEAPVSVEMVVRTLAKNTEVARQSIRNMVQDAGLSAACSCQIAMADAVITQPGAITESAKQRLGILYKH
jgi:5'-methylthioadenosine phosphorylase